MNGSQMTNKDYEGRKYFGEELMAKGGSKRGAVWEHFTEEEGKIKPRSWDGASIVRKLQKAQQLGLRHT
jgi:hypothetical protein